MSSTESSGAPAEATETNPAPDAAFPTFGTTRGSGLARGKKRSHTGPATAASAAPASDYQPTAIEVVNAPREYVNPFAPAEEPKVESAPTPVAAPVVSAPAPIIAPAPVAEVAPVEAVDESPAELNILPPAEPKTSTAQTWESEGFRPAREVRESREPREPRAERPRYEERAAAPADEPVDVDSIPAQFLYVRPGVTFVPTPRNWGGAPRERRPRDESAPRSESAPRPSANSTPAAASAATGGFLGWLKSLFGGPASAEPVTAGTDSGEPRREGGGQRRNRGGRSRGGSGGEGGQRRSRGGRGRSGGGGGGGYRGERSEGTRNSGSL